MYPRDAPITAAVVPVQLQNAARELQAAIQSVRRHRESAIRATDLATSSCADGAAYSDGNGDKENASGQRNADGPCTLARLAKATCAAIASEGGGSLTTNLDVDKGDGEDALRLSQLSGLSGLSGFDSEDSDAWSIGERDPTATATQQQETAARPAAPVNETLNEDAREALRWMQRDVERQARANKAANECLVRAIGDITDAITDAVPGAAARLSSVTAMVFTDRVLAANLVVGAVAQWELALAEWKEQQIKEKQELAQRFTDFRDQCESRLQTLESTHQRECEHLQRLLQREQEASSVREGLQEEERSNMHKMNDELSCKIERLQCESEDLAGQVLRYAANSATARSLSALSATPLTLDVHQVRTREHLDLAALAKEADLRALQWEMAFEERSDVLSRTDARLQMLLEEQRVRDEMANQTLERMVPRQTVEVYQERIGWLEDHVRDIHSQIACDHEQFEYEVAKWEQEKQGVRSELDEIHGVSVKLLKLLLIREKLQKKREHKHQLRLKSTEHKLEASKSALKQVVQTLMQESAALLLVLQQLIVQAVSVPVKPVHVRAIIKQLKHLDRGLDKTEANTTCDHAVEETTLSMSMDSALSEAGFEVSEAERPREEREQESGRK